jgi:ABC-type sugar transport system ATPase subunit
MSCVLKVENLCKSYPGVRAVNNISLELNAGEVLALLGENGAGKSTLTKLICGAVKPDSGSIYIDGKHVSFESSYDAMRMGLAMVYQELSMVGGISVAENVYMNWQPVRRCGMVDWPKLYADTSKLLKKFNLDIDPRALVKRLPVGTQQLLEILKALSLAPKVIVLDEPTSSLTETEIELVFKNIEALKAEGYAFIYITHKLSEIFKISDRVMVMRDGEFVDLKRVSELTEDAVVTMMVGREIKDLYGSERVDRQISRDFFFEVRGMSAKGLYSDISFGARKGEVLGFAGLIGAGRTEMGLGIVGAHKRDSGKIYLDGREISIRGPAEAIANKVAYSTEDRKQLGLYLNYSVKANVIATGLGSFATTGMMREGKVASYVDALMRKFNIISPSREQKVGNLSGGNQQKCLLAMWMGIDPDVLIVDEPTRGVDVGAKAEIYELIRLFAGRGKSVIVISSELPELLGICDRIVVMHAGRIKKEVPKKDFSEDLIMHYAAGLS